MKLISSKSRIRPDGGRLNFIRKINESENVSCLLNLALRLHYACLVWQWISLH